MQDEKVTVSVLCLCYNHANYLRMALDSVLCQKTNFSYEIIIYDDASTDESQKIIREYTSAHQNRIKAILQSENQYSKGRSVLNILSQAATGEFIIFLECDDFWQDEYKLQKQVNALRAHQECVLCVHRVELYFENGITKEQYVPAKPLPESILNRDQLVSYIAQIAQFHTTSRLMRASLYQEAQRAPYFAQSKRVGDLPLLLSFAQLGSFYYLPDTMTGYRMASKGSYSERLQTDWNFFCQVRQELHEMWTLFGECHPEYQQIAEEQAEYYWKEEIRGRLSSGLKEEYKKVHSEPYLTYYLQLSIIDKAKGVLCCYFPKTAKVLKCIWKKLRSWVKHEE